MDRHLIRLAQRLSRDMALAADDREMDREEFAVALWARDTVFPQAVARWVDQVGQSPEWAISDGRSSQALDSADQG
jgi:hypothetical protein